MELSGLRLTRAQDFYFSNANENRVDVKALLKYMVCM